MSAAAPAPAAATDATPVAPAKGKKKLIIILAAVAVLLAGAGGGAFFLMKKKAADAAAAEDEGDGTHEVAKSHKKDDHALPVFVPLDPFIVNLADRDTDRFAQIGITLQVDDAHAGDTIKAYMPAIRNNILLLLSRKTVEELSGAEGKERLAREVLRVSVLPMGVELAPEEDEGADAAASAPAPKPKAKKHYDSIDSSPVKGVQFSSFIIQ